MLHFHKGYCLAASGLLLVEIFIGLFMHDRFIRPYAGDFLATIFLYCLFRSFLKASAWKLAVAAAIISYLIEGLQYLDVQEQLGWHSRVARIVFGSHFEWGDMLAYTLGGLLALVVSLRIDVE